MNELKYRIERSKYKLLMGATGIASLLAPTTVAADSTSSSGLDISVGEDGSVTIGNGYGSLSDVGTEVQSLGNQIVGWITAIGLIIVVVCCIVAGVLFATSVGNPSKRQTAKSAIVGCIIGAAVIGGAIILTNLAYGIFNGI